MDIADWRKTIDGLDEQIVALISKRAEAAKAIGALKAQSTLPVYEPARETHAGRCPYEAYRIANVRSLADTLVRFSKSPGLDSE